jgi:UDP-N-acetylmuramate--alanine ligase
MGYKRIACIFQPHTFSRTHHLYSSFLGAFSLAYKSYIIPTYRARNENEYEVDERKLACECGAEFLENYEGLKEIISSREYDCLVLMGAGDIGKLKKYL